MTSNNAWIRWRSAGYMAGHGLLWGVDEPVYPLDTPAPGCGCVYADIRKTAFRVEGGPVAPLSQVHELATQARRSFNFVMVGPRFQQVDDPIRFVREGADRLRVGGHMLLWAKDDPGCPTSVMADLLQPCGSWLVKDVTTRNGSHLMVAKLTGNGKSIRYWRRPEGPRACIVRYGAIGDMVQATPLIRALARDGFAVTMNVSPYAVDVLANNPHVTNIIPHERNVIPNYELDRYWNEWKGEYDRYINLSESVEGRLLKIEKRRDYYTPQGWRHERCNESYHDATMARGGYGTDDPQPELFLTAAERAEARRRVAAFGRDTFVVGWGLRGSSLHKQYTPLAETLGAWLDAHADAAALLFGKEGEEAAAFTHPRVASLVGKVSLRETFALLEQCHVVGGPESAVINAASAFPNVAKIVLLSHSSPTNLTKYWVNTITLEPDRTVAPCHPCHQMHYPVQLPSGASTTSCPMGPGGPICSTGAIPPEALKAALDEAYATHRQRLAA